MLDIQFIRDNPDLVQKKSEQKGYKIDIQRLLQVDVERRQLLAGLEALRAKRNQNVADIKQHGKPSEEVIHQGKLIKMELAQQEDQLKPLEDEFVTLLKQVPNMPLDDVPVGASEDENVVIKEWGSRPEFDFEPKNHWEIGQLKGWIDKERAAKVSGSRFAYIKGDLVRLQWALIQWAVNQLSDPEYIKKIVNSNDLSVNTKPFVPVLPPLLIQTELYDAMDRLEPRDDRYKIEGEELWLQGSAEHVLGSMHAGETFDEQELPIRYAGYATSFRKEAGTYGKDSEGIIRMHQFDKLEMESLSTPESSLQEHFLMVAIQEDLMQQLELPYRLLLKCTADIGKPNSRGVDIDVWLPGQQKYRETHTADHMTDYQARRLGTRFRGADGQAQLVHTNDATAFSQRPLIGIIENFQDQEGNVAIPTVLRPYMGDKTHI